MKGNETRTFCQGFVSLCLLESLWEKEKIKEKKVAFIGNLSPFNYEFGYRLLSQVISQNPSLFCPEQMKEVGPSAELISLAIVSSNC